MIHRNQVLYIEMDVIYGLAECLAGTRIEIKEEKKRKERTVLNLTVDLRSRASQTGDSFRFWLIG